MKLNKVRYQIERQISQIENNTANEYAKFRYGSLYDEIYSSTDRDTYWFTSNNCIYIRNMYAGDPLQETVHRQINETIKSIVHRDKHRSDC
jgi:hypothetical protein